jgi:hypothetical protein
MQKTESTRQQKQQQELFPMNRWQHTSTTPVKITPLPAKNGKNTTISRYKKTLKQI